MKTIKTVLAAIIAYTAVALIYMAGMDPTAEQPKEVINLRAQMAMRQYEVMPGISIESYTIDLMLR
jgi:hypothetical protein